MGKKSPTPDADNLPETDAELEAGDDLPPDAGGDDGEDGAPEDASAPPPPAAPAEEPDPVEEALNQPIDQDRTLVSRGTRNLPVKLTEGELNHNARLSVEAHAKASGIEAEFASIKAGYKVRIADAWTEHERLVRLVNNGEEVRKVPTEVVANFAENVVQTIRTDTGEVVESRAMKAEERQGDLFRRGKS